MEQEDLEQSPLSPISTKKAPSKSVDLIAKCSIPTKIQSTIEKGQRKRRVTTRKVRTQSNDEFHSLDSKLATLFQCGDDLPLFPIDLPPQRVTVQKEQLPTENSSIPQLDFSKLMNHKKSMKEIDYISILAALNGQMAKEKGDLDDLLDEISRHASNICEISDTLISHKSYNVRFLRSNAIRAALYEDLAIERANSMLDTTRYNIQVIDQFQQYLNTIETKKASYPQINYDIFLTKYIKQYNESELQRYDLQLSILSTRIKPIKDVKGDSVSQFLSPNSKSGRIVSRFIRRIKEMTYGDLDVILTAVVPSEHTFPIIRSLMFDLAWQQFPYPFTTVSNLEFPKIFDLTPRSINPPFLPDQYLDTPFATLNSIDWPFQFTYFDLFELTCYRNPFKIANRFYDIIQTVANRLQELAIESGKNEDDVEIDFDNLFSNILVCVIAFGSPEILNTLEYCAKFVDYTLDVRQQFAMTHCAGIIQYIQTTTTEKFRRRVKLKKSISIFSFFNS